MDQSTITSEGDEKQAIFKNTSNTGIAILLVIIGFFIVCRVAGLFGAMHGGISEVAVIFLFMLLIVCVWFLFCIVIMIGQRSTGGWRLPITMALYFVAAAVLAIFS
jgi:hypothetical protein